MSGAGSALSFLTVIGRGTRPTPGAVVWFPLVGFALGALLGLIWWLAIQVWPPPVAAAVVVLADLALTGMLHFDGLADSADGLLPHMAESRRLEVMSRPDTGAFAVAVVAVTILSRFAALSALAPSPLLLAALWATSRSIMALGMAAMPYARPGGIAADFIGTPSRVTGILGVAAGASAAAVWHLVAGPMAVAASVAAGAGVLALARRRIGGYTGDVLGASGVSAETIGLMVAAARW